MRLTHFQATLFRPLKYYFTHFILSHLWVNFVRHVVVNNDEINYTRKLCYRKGDRAMCAVAEIWPFQIIQDGGGLFEFVRIENSAIRSAVSENPTL